MNVVRTLGFCALATAAATGCSFLLDDDYSSGLGSSGSSGSSSSSSGGSNPGPWGRPAEGTYSYTVTGNDGLSGPFIFSTSYGPTASATVRHRGDSCFTLTLVLRSGYEEAIDECVRGADVVNEAGLRNQRFSFIGGAKTELTCAPGDVYVERAPSPGKQWTHDCTGKNVDDKSGDSAFRTTGPYRFDGSETIAIGGRDVGVMHYHDERDVSGSQTGRNVADWYFAADTGLLIRLVRNIDIEYGSVVGTINYKETVELVLTSTSPAPLPGGSTGADASTAARDASTK